MPKVLTKEYLSDNMQKHLSEYEAIFDFVVQFQLNEKEMPINDSSIEWDEKKSPFIKVAEIIIPTTVTNIESYAITFIKIYKPLFIY